MTLLILRINNAPNFLWDLKACIWFHCIYPYQQGQALLLDNTLPFFLNTIDKAGLTNVVIPIISTSVEAGEVWSKPLAMVFIDGGHSEKAANEDYDTWSPHLIRGGLLAIHDVFPNPEDGGRPPFNIYTKAKESGLFKELDMINSLALLEKL